MFPLPLLSVPAAAFDVTHTLPKTSLTYTTQWRCHNQQSSVFSSTHCCHSNTPPPQSKSAGGMYTSAITSPIQTGPQNIVQPPACTYITPFIRKKTTTSASPWTKRVFNFDKTFQTGPRIAPLLQEILIGLCQEEVLPVKHTGSMEVG